jgi:hypothetical protein
VASAGFLGNASRPHREQRSGACSSAVRASESFTRRFYDARAKWPANLLRRNAAFLGPREGRPLALSVNLTICLDRLPADALMLGKHTDLFRWHGSCSSKSQSRRRDPAAQVRRRAPPPRRRNPWTDYVSLCLGGVITMHKLWLFAPAILAFAVGSPSAARAAAVVSCVDGNVCAGFDLFRTDPAGTVFQTSPTGPQISFAGVPLGTFNFGGTIGTQSTGLTDTIVQRLANVTTAGGSTLSSSMPCNSRVRCKLEGISCSRA